jgi:hypothetical protein
MMQMLYDSESFVVVHMQSDISGTTASTPLAEELKSSAAASTKLVRNGFEIVDKRSGKEVYLDGSWAEFFQKKINAWREKTPTQEEVENTLASYATLAQNPIVAH